MDTHLGPRANSTPRSAPSRRRSREAHPEQTLLLPQLVERQRRLRSELAVSEDQQLLQSLLHQVDDALDKLHDGMFGLCDICHDVIEDERILADPLIEVCLSCLSDKQRHELEQDLSLASRIQGKLLPDQDLENDAWQVHYHYEPAGPVSGDYADVLLPDREGEPLHFFLGDVSGKGVSASILMSNLQAIFRSLVSAGLSLTELVSQANRLFVDTTLPTHFATLVVGKAAADGTIELVNAGHWPPLIVNGGRSVAVEAGGLPIGMFADSEYASQTLRLAPGEILFLHTDGLSEATNGGPEQYGLQRIQEVLATGPFPSARAATATSLADWRAFGGSDGGGDDDLSIMAIRRV